MRSTIGRRRLILLLAGSSLGLAACSTPQAVAPTSPPTSAPAKPAAAAPAASPAAAAPAAASPVAAGSPAAAGSPGTDKPEAGLPPGAVPGGTFTIASIGPLPKTVHPYPDSANYSSGWTEVARLIYGGGLIDQDANSLEYTPYAAKEWSISPDGKTFTFKLRDDLKWSDGKPITVDDYLFAYSEAVKEENDYVGLDDVQRLESFTSPAPATAAPNSSLMAAPGASMMRSGVRSAPGPRRNT